MKRKPWANGPTHSYKGYQKLVKGISTVTKQLRMKANLNKTDLSKLCGINHASLIRFEGKKTSPDIYTLFKIAKGLRIPLSKIIAQVERQ